MFALLSSITLVSGVLQSSAASCGVPLTQPETLLSFPDAGSSRSAPVLSPAVDDYLVTQPFVYNTGENGFACSSGYHYMVAEDCYPVVDYVVEEVDIWMLFHNDIPVEEYNIGFQGDAGGLPDGAFICYGVETHIINEDTGFSNWGYEFWHTHITLANPPMLEAGGAYWFCLQAQSPYSNIYCLARNNYYTWNEMFCFSDDNGLTWVQSVQQWGASYGMFLVLDGSTTSFGRQTWAGIKASF